MSIDPVSERTRELRTGLDVLLALHSIRLFFRHRQRLEAHG